MPPTADMFLADGQLPRVPFVFRFDASRAAGAGHFMRQLAIAQRAAAVGGATMLVPLGAEALVSHVTDDIRCQSLPTMKPGRELEWLWRRFGNEPILVIDSYRLPLSYYRALDERMFVVAFEDGERDLPAALVVKPRPLAAHARPLPGVLEGCDYLPVRQEFVGASGHTIETRVDKAHLVLSFGASDPTGAAARVLSQLPPALAPHWRVTIACGPLEEEATQLPLADLASQGWEIEAEHAPHMPTLLASADAAVVAAGSVLWELATLAVPALAYAVVGNQLRNASQLRASGCIAGGRLLGSDLSRVTEELVEFLSEHRLRAQMAERLAALVDGRGADRIVSAARQGVTLRTRGAA